MKLTLQIQSERKTLGSNCVHSNGLVFILKMACRGSNNARMLHVTRSGNGSKSTAEESAVKRFYSFLQMLSVERTTKVVKWKYAA